MDNNAVKINRGARNRSLRLLARTSLTALSIGTVSLAMFSLGGVARAEEAAAAGDDSVFSMSIEELMDIQITSVSKRPEKLRDAPAAVEVLTGEDIHRSGATSIPEALELMGNLDVAQKNAHDWIISSRGFSSDVANKLLVMMDGRTVYTPLFSGVFWDRQNYVLADIDRIESVSGPGGTLWGANAVNGVINITTKSAKNTQGLYFEAGGGENPRSFTSLRYGGTLAPDVYYRVYGQYANRDNAALPNGVPAGDAWHTGQAGFRVDAQARADDSFTFQGDIYDNAEGLVTGGRGIDTGGNVLGRWSRTLSETSEMSVQAYYDHTHLALPEPALLFAPAGTFIDDLDTFDVEFQHGFQWGSGNRIIWGAGYRYTHDHAQNAPSLAFLPPVLNQSLADAFVQDEISLSKVLTLTLGTKVEHNDYTGFEVEPSARLQWRPTDMQTVWGAISRAVRMPSRIDHDLSEPAPQYLLALLRGDSQFRSETLVAYEAGYRAQFSPNFSGSISTFYNAYDDVRSTAPGPLDPTFHLPFPVFFENNLEGHTYGFQLGADVKLVEWWRLHANYQLLRGHLHVKPGAPDVNNALNETNDPKDQASLRSSMDLPWRTQFDAGLRWVGTRTINKMGAATYVPAFAELETRLGWKVTDSVELSIAGQNLLRAYHPEYSAPGPTQGQIGRSVYAKLIYRM